MKLAVRRGKSKDKIKRIVDLLQSEKSLPPKNRDHPLSGNWKDHRECHIEPDWLLIYKIEDGILFLERTGTHADLFE